MQKARHETRQARPKNPDRAFSRFIVLDRLMLRARPIENSASPITAGSLDGAANAFRSLRFTDD
jgi:hypothetical protein